MISEDYDHRWEALAEVHFNRDNDNNDDNFIYCLCSRVFVRDGVKLYYVEKENGSESDVDVQREREPQCEADDHSHVHFSADTSDKVKCEKDEVASCYCSASHTDNYYSTDEHDPTHITAPLSHNLQTSDSGADLTYQDCHSDFNQQITNESLHETESLENYFSEETWEKFWSINGERLIWTSWINKYSDYINPTYLDDNKDLCMDDNNVPKEYPSEEVFDKLADEKPDESIRERKFSYDSKVNPYKKKNDSLKADKNLDLNVNGADCLAIGRRRSCSEHDRMLSPRTVTNTDSMTNVTKITLSSYDVTSSHVTSESTPDDYSVSSNTSEDHSNDQTRIANIDDVLDTPLDETDTDSYWQLLWKKHFGEQYARHYANYIEKHNVQIPSINIEIVDKVKVDCEIETSEGNSQELPTVIELASSIDNIKIDDKVPKQRRKKKSSNNKYANSVGCLLQKLLKEETSKDVQVVDSGEVNENNEEKPVQESNEAVEQIAVANVTSVATSTPIGASDWNGGDEPPEDKPISFKKSHEIEENYEATEKDKISSTFNTMGLIMNEVPKGTLVYRKRNARLRLPRSKKFGGPKKTYFDEDGNPYNKKQQDSQDECEMLSDDDARECRAMKYKKLTKEDINTKELLIPNIIDLDTSLSDERDGHDLVKNKSMDEVAEAAESTNAPETKRKRRKRHHSPAQVEMMPLELIDQPIMKKYWKRRHSLFHRFDEGIKLDIESWFSVTPEKVAKHLAERCRCDLIVDAFCGAGGNTIQFAWQCERVIAIDIDPEKIAMARHNATVYGVAERVEFIVGDFFALAPTLNADVVFLSPPWGGPKYTMNENYDLETMLEPKPVSELMKAAEGISQNIALYVPRNTRSEQLVSLAKTCGAVEIEQNFLGRRFIALTAYYGDLVN